MLRKAIPSTQAALFSLILNGISLQISVLFSSGKVNRAFGTEFTGNLPMLKYLKVWRL